MMEINTLLIALTCISFSTALEDQIFWNEIGQDQLQIALGASLNTNEAKNVIIFVGDGMGVTTTTAGRILKGQQMGQNGEEGYLAFEKFPHSGLAKTYCVNYQIPDSACTANAFLTGVKTNKALIGVDSTVSRYNCSSITPENKLDSIAKWAQDAGKRTGFVTSTRVTHATPANLYAHGADRDWECDAQTQAYMEECPDLKDYGLQLIEDEPGKSFNVILGGGYQELDGSAVDLPGDPVDRQWGCVRADNRTLWEEWTDTKVSEGKTVEFVRNKTQLLGVDLNSTEYLMGIFSNDHMPYEYEKRELGLDLPTLAEMTEAAIKLLSQGSNGYFLMVEGGMIDQAHHDCRINVVMDEVLALDEAVAKALNLTNEQDTLIVVTADHSHTLSISGDPERGTPITGIAGYGDDGLPYTTLMYANGPGFNYSSVDGQVVRMNVSEMDNTLWDYRPQAAVPKAAETHAGEDVIVYAKGPMSHLFSTVYEQNYIAHAIGYASCVGIDQSHCSPSP